ncbi:MAG TPA: serine/threonine-protein kinase, partial [Polyangiaceae bacterium]
LEHPNIVRVFRIDEHEGRPFIAYEYVRGENLERLLKPVRWQTALAICTRVARALGAANDAGLLHRDVKPANVMISVSGEVKLLDFGLAIERGDDGAPVDAETASQRGHAELASGERLTAPGLAVGTPRYWAPEQWQACGSCRWPTSAGRSRRSRRRPSCCTARAT